MARKPRPRESDFQATVVDLAQRAGWKVMTIRPVRVQRKGGAIYYETPFGADGVGWPDLSLAHPRFGLAFFELKREGEGPSDEQLEWNIALGRHALALVVRPSDWSWLERFLTTGKRE